jgi:hypothetical protein
MIKKGKVRVKSREFMEQNCRKKGKSENFSKEEKIFSKSEINFLERELEEEVKGRFWARILKVQVKKRMI